MYMLVSIACMYCFCFVLCRCLYVCLYVSLYAGCEGAGSFAGARCSLAATKLFIECHPVIQFFDGFEGSK